MLAVLFALAVTAPTVEDREADMFGEVATASAAEANDEPEGPAPLDREAALFGETAPPSPMDRMSSLLEVTDDVLAIGARLFLQGQYAAETEGDPARFAISSANLLDLYLDARLSDRVRVYTRGRLSYDPTIREGATDLANRPLEPLEASLDQLWLKFDVARVVYATVGRQPIKWGSGRIWNPSDFVNQSARDPLAVFDQRLGVNLVKLHLPWESIGWNLYAVATFDGADAPERIGGGVRAEALVGLAEIALSGLFAKDQPIRLAADLSVGVWAFDLRAEASLTKGDETPFYRAVAGADPFEMVESFSREDEWILRALGGFDATIKYSDEDSLILGAEYFYNGAGYEDPALYTFLAFRGAFTPLYTGRHYAAVFALAMSPGSWNDTTLLLNAIGNLSDRSFVIRYDHRVTLLTYLKLNLYGAVHVGEEGELRFAPRVAPGAIPGLDAGLSRAAPLFEIGGGVTVDF